MNTNNIKELFKKLNLNEEYSVTYNKAYMIAMTPRCGSSYLTDLLTNLKNFGRPGEFLPYEHIKIALTNLKKECPSVQNHFSWVINQTTTNGIFGQKASYYQTAPFLEWNGENLFKYLFPNTKFIYMLRRNIIKQAISLYIATESHLFHTNIKHDEITLRKKELIKYSNEKILHWILHIYDQEIKWENYFSQENIIPLQFYYEDFIKSKELYLSKLLKFIDPNHNTVIKQKPSSVFKPVVTNKNQEFYETFINNRDNLSKLNKLGLSNDRF